MNSNSSQKTGARGVFLWKDFAQAVFKFSASLQLAVGTLITLMAVLAVGTIVESRYSADAARILVYGTPWFGFILLVLVLNLACSAADRLPWKKKHIGFVMTHLGIITIIFGSLATQQSALDAQIMLEEGSSGKWVTLKQPMIYLYSQAFKDEQRLPFRERVFRWKGREKLSELKAEGRKAEVVLTQFYPKVRAESKWIAAAEGPAAVQVTLHNSRMNVTQWIADQASSNEVQMGPAVLKFAAELLQPVADISGQKYFEIQRGDEKLQIPVPEKSALPYEKQFENGVTVRVLELYAFAYVEENILKEGAAPEHAENPAAVLQISASVPSAQPAAEAKTVTEIHTVFSNFPDFPTVHGRAQSELGVIAQFRIPNSGSKGESHELRFVSTPEGLQYQIQTGSKLQQGAVQVGQNIATGWMDLQFRVEQAFPHATTDLIVTPLEDDDKSESAKSAVEIEIKSATSAQKFWVVEGAHKTQMFEGGLIETIFGRRQLPLGFEIALKDFRVKNDPGTTRAASFESDVVLKDFARGTSIEKTISMNEPLIYRGFRVYQAGYTPNPDGKELSVFVVGRDPGIPVKYAGALIMVAGILLMFYTRAYSTRTEKGLQ